MTTPTSRNARGIWLMVASMAAFAVADVFVKISASNIAPAQTSFLLLAGGWVIFTGLALLQRAPLLDRRAFLPVMLWRYLAEGVAALGMVLALANVPLSSVGAILQATPLVVTAGAVLILGEVVSWRRWSAIVVGFVGVLLIVQPGTAGFNAAALWAVLAMAGLAGRDLTTRVAPQGMAGAALAAFTMTAILPFAALWCLLSEGAILPPVINWPVVIAMSGFGAVGYLLIIASVRAAEVSVVSPFRYSRLIFLLIFGMVFFSERPDVVTLLGAAIIIASGIYTMWRDRLSKT